jgi:hypothetical protein
MARNESFFQEQGAAGCSGAVGPIASDQAEHVAELAITVQAGCELSQPGPRLQDVPAQVRCSRSEVDLEQLGELGGFHPRLAPAHQMTHDAKASFLERCLDGADPAGTARRAPIRPPAAIRTPAPRTGRCRPKAATSPRDRCAPGARGPRTGMPGSRRLPRADTGRPGSPLGSPRRPAPPPTRTHVQPRRFRQDSELRNRRARAPGAPRRTPALPADPAAVRTASKAAPPPRTTRRTQAHGKRPSGSLSRRRRRPRARSATQETERHEQHAQPCDQRVPRPNHVAVAPIFE